MNRITLILVVVGCLGVAAAEVRAQTTAPATAETATVASWSFPAAATVRQAVLRALREAGAKPPAAVEQFDQAWPESQSDLRGGPLFEKTVATLAASYPGARSVVEQLAQPGDLAVLKSNLLVDPKTPAVVRHNLRLFAAQRLAERQMYDELLELLAGVEPAEVADPAALLFYRAVAQHRTLKIGECLATTEQLLEQADRLPQRYRTLATLMQRDLANVKDGTLDHVSRQMDDVSRRLELGRGGPQVRQSEADILAALDKMIKKLEEQQQQASAGGANQPRPAGKPLEKSMPAGGKGEGKVDRKDLGQGRGWGDLPPKQREEALQRIGQDFPAHYREVIEEYFRRLAHEGEEKAKE